MQPNTTQGFIHSQPSSSTIRSKTTSIADLKNYFQIGNQSFSSLIQRAGSYIIAVHKHIFRPFDIRIS